jgi:release factor glutamine methyltransferase
MPEVPGGVAVATLGEVLREATLDLRRAGVVDGGNDARRLAGWVLGLSGAQVLSQPDRLLSADEAQRYRRAIARRCRREPVSRIIGSREFYGRSFAISPATLDPRPDSETLIDTALEIVGRERWLNRPLRILDVGTGSGCLLLTLLSELPKARGVGTDISEHALEIARKNALALDLGDRAEWLACDMLAGVEGPFDIVVSNPPYVRSDEIAQLEPEVRCYDPRAALEGGKDGLQAVRRLSAGIRRVIPDGWAILEVGLGQAEPVAGLLVAAGAGVAPADFLTRADVAGVLRCVAARTREPDMPRKALGIFRYPR